jgi:hypothetical protein
MYVLRLISDSYPKLIHVQAYLIIAVVVGASLGHYIFGATMDVDSILNDASGGKGMACH